MFNVVVAQQAIILELFTLKVQAWHVRWNSTRSADFYFYILDGVGWADVECCHLAFGASHEDVEDVVV